MRTFVLGDIHGARKAVEQCFDRSGIDLTKDRLIFLGDVSDRGPETVEAVELLLKVKNRVILMGNHDFWTKQWLEGEIVDEELWFQNGGLSTYQSYVERTDSNNIRTYHLKSYYQQMIPYFEDDQNRLFVHAGINLGGRPTHQTDIHDLVWSRDLFRSAVNYRQENRVFPQSDPYNEIYIGHSPTIRLDFIDGTVPVKCCNVWCMDQGAGWGYKLSMMDVDSKDIYQSDKVSALY